MTRWPTGSVREIDSVLSIVHFLYDVGPVKGPAIRHHRYKTDNLQRRHADLLPHGHVTDRTPVPLGYRLGQATLFTGQINAGLLAESELLDVLSHAFFLEAKAQRDRANVGRFLHDLADGQDAKRFVVVYPLSGNDDGTQQAIDALIGSRQAFFEGGTDGQNLECRSGLVGVLDRSVLPKLRIVVSPVVWVEGRVVLRGEDRTIAEIHDPDIDGGSVRSGNRIVHRLPHDKLNILIQCCHEIGARLRRLLRLVVISASSILYIDDFPG